MFVINIMYLNLASQKHINVIGYYGHFNIGDEQYKTSFKKFFGPEFELSFIDCDDIFNYKFTSDEIIILGGGDILNSYFIDKIIRRFIGTSNKLIAISVGLPFVSYLTTNKLKIIDKIYIRTKQDLELFKKYHNNVEFIPDMSFIELYKLKSMKKNKIIGISLTQYINIKKYIKFLLELDYKIIFIPFDTSKDDVEIHKKIKEEIEKEVKNSNQIQIMCHFESLYSILDYTISMRYHGCLFSIQNNVPVIPIYNTRKIQNLIYDLGINDFIDLSEPDLEISDKLIKIHKNEPKNIIYSEYLESSFYKLRKELLLETKETSRKSIEYYYKHNDYFDIMYDEFKNYNGNKAQLLSYYLTNNTDSIYLHGLTEKTDKFLKDKKEAIKEWSWVIGNFKNHKLKNNKNGLFNLNYIQQYDMSGVHRSGWAYVYENIKDQHNDSKIILDLYIDRTFLWNYEINKYLKLIPYTKEWCGFIHHTFDETFSSNNCVNLFKNNDFILSLKYCKCLFVLSKYLKDQIDLLNINVPVYVIYHPTELNVPKFSLNQFLKNKRIINVGSWLRNIYYFYNVEFKKQGGCFSDNLNINKAILVSKNMSNYLLPRPTDFLEQLKCFLKNFDNNIPNHSYISTNCSYISTNCNEKNEITNNWLRHLYDDLETKIKKVELIEFQDNKNYDKLLSENIVFIYLVDASAVNTVIECLARNTPLVVNKHPAVVEILGPRYPLYLEDISGITVASIIKTNLYMFFLNKNKLRIETFKNKLYEFL